MKRPRIRAARRVAEEHGAKQAIIIVFYPDGRVGGASYGDTKRSCADVAPVLDAIVDGLAAGRIRAPGGLPPPITVEGEPL